jgi:hypothetical protein
VTGVSFSPVYFGFDSYQLAPVEVSKIEQVAQHLLQNSSHVVLIDGHCDERGSNEYNLSLGQQRALIDPVWGGVYQYSAATDGRFFYGGGHMEKHASLIGLGSMNNAGLTAAMATQLGSDITVGFSQPQLAGGGFGSAEVYARVLRKLLAGQLQMGALLGSSSVCTNPLTCGTAQALYTPVPPQESWRYSLGHWVESDPVVGDGAFSSLGAFGFYPWIDARRTYYGVLARAASNGARSSSLCGRLIRKAWDSGVALPESTTAAPGAVAGLVPNRRR